MRLNGITAEPGTFMGFTQRMGIRIGLIINWMGFGHVNLRPAKHGEVDQAAIPDPRSVAEHDALPRIRTVYGMGRTFNPSTMGLGLMADDSYLNKIREEKKIKVARRRNRADLAHLYRLREGRYDYPSLKTR